MRNSRLVTMFNTGGVASTKGVYKRRLQKDQRQSGRKVTKGMLLR
jgi:hypothetical protein